MTPNARWKVTVTTPGGNGEDVVEKSVIVVAPSSADAAEAAVKELEGNVIDILNVEDAPEEETIPEATLDDPIREDEIPTRGLVDDDMVEYHYEPCPNCQYQMRPIRCNPHEVPPPVLNCSNCHLGMNKSMAEQLQTGHGCRLVIPEQAEAAAV